MNRNESFISTASKLLEKAKQQQLNMVDDKKLTTEKSSTTISKATKKQQALNENQYLVIDTNK